VHCGWEGGGSTEGREGESEWLYQHEVTQRIFLLPRLGGTYGSNENTCRELSAGEVALQHPNWLGLTLRGDSGKGNLTQTKRKRSPANQRKGTLLADGPFHWGP